MIKKILLFGLILLYSCTYFKVEKITSEEILEEELKTFSWNEVDTYPKFPNGETTKASKEEEAQQLSQQIASYLQKDLQQIVVKAINNDTIVMHLSISAKGKVALKSVEIDSLTAVEIPNLKNYLNQSISNLPQLLPALKRGQPVHTEFTLPIILQAQ